ncbi:SPOR domain-containing protein [Desulfobacter hydrogenophilus]|uniref:SPOR domain-containing protein n=1 Tax=Desulfobacter hydrogenophilus TaxID=2291 RepID=A0A328F886_9BACT|nr:SPOR domain-containing protein [Desulfobacter hydrogenophilus]NDY73260.1 SPOR domain-containing protein [Desulfobacter hydrogenophilus]QBH13836.1 SPOR domain-containing protein [Desulfobacter hydrogenophilus]RAM00851.1 SPOR domain-containing protein [Desulfobacter hydrogenophilus]
MFGLGLFVGRGSSPVLFETRPFQEYLGRMLSELSAKFPEKGKVDLKFYDVLDEPVYSPVKGTADDSGEITPGPETGEKTSMNPAPYNSQAEDIPVKRSRKLATWNKAGQGYDNATAPAPPAKKSASVKTYKKAAEKQTVTQSAPKVLKSKTQAGKKTDAVPQKTKPDTGKAPAPAHGGYTIQVASYKNLNDALAQMVLLNKKGITAYRASVKIDGKTWYRVRTGSFANYEAARTGLVKLAGSGVNGMVIKKE